MPDFCQPLNPWRVVRLLVIPIHHTNSPETALARSVYDFVGARIFSALLAYLPVTLGAQPVYFGLHPFQQLFGGFGRDAGALEILNLFSLPQDLAAHALDFGADVVNVHVRTLMRSYLEQKGNTMASR
jgi:hypothetical protein